MKRLQLRSITLILALLIPLYAFADNSTTAGGYTIHHNAFTTSTLTPEVANAYQIKRSKFRGMLNLSIIKNGVDKTGTPVPGQVEVNTVALTGQSTPLPMREIKEQDAVYYIGEFPVQNREKINFVITVKPEGSTETFTVKMEQEFFTD